MMIIMNVEATEAQVEAVVVRIKDNGFKPIVLHGEERKVIAVVGNNPYIDPRALYFPAGGRPGDADLAPV